MASSEKALAAEVVERLEKALRIREEEFVALLVSKYGKDPFALLVATILSQNTNDRNALRAFNALRNQVGVDPGSLAKADISVIERAVRPAGLYRARARVLKEVAKAVVERWGGDFSRVLDLPPEEAWRELTGLPGVGAKTADVVLLFLRKYPFFPVDTHIHRVVRRIGLAPEKAGRDEVRERMMRLLPPDKYLSAHLLLIAHGRRYCRARKPLCNECPIRDLCKWGAGDGLVEKPR